ncbi:hypothetical protein [Rhizomonospora bruguierae]|uniref:hypothetical protein n=1 Tax=Rhizomonospora bruguierae TaxID=1581705 RepID=UPI001BCADB2A|nr:hypothetical protein [Micromonospora sp. NBRC 107566]
MADRTPPWVEPWSEPTVETKPGMAGSPAFSRGVAQVNPNRPGQPEPYATVDERTAEARWEPRPEPVPYRFDRRQLRRGGGWTWAGGLWAFICWGIWAVSVRGADLVVPTIAFALVLSVAAGVFVLSRLVGRVVLERTLGRRRRSAWVAHLLTGLFLVGAGLAYLRQTQWVVEVWTWLRGFRA